MKQPLRVLHVIDNMKLGGAQRLIVDYMTRMAPLKNGIQLELAVLYGRNDYAGVLDGERVHVLSGTKNPWRIGVGLYRLIRNGGYDILHLHLYFSKLFGRLIAGAFFRRRVKIIVHEGNTIDFEFRRYFWYPLIVLGEKILARYTDRILCVSHFVKRFYVDRVGLDPSQCGVLYNGLDYDRLDADPRDPADGFARLNKKRKADSIVFGFLSRVHYQKGIETLIRAFDRLITRDPAYAGHSLIIAGYGPLRERMQRLVSQCRLENNITFIDVDDTNKYAFFQFIDCFVLPSIYEPFGIVLLEALYYKVPVIASAVGGIIEVLKYGAYGDLVTSGSVERLEDAMRQFIGTYMRDSRAYVRRSEQAYADIRERFTIDEGVRELERIYTDVAGNTVS